MLWKSVRGKDTETVTKIRDDGNCPGGELEQS